MKIRIKSKKGILKNYIIGLLIFSMVITSFWLVPQRVGGFFSKYDYSTTETLNLDVSDNVSRQIDILAGDIIAEGEDGGKNFYQSGTEFISGIIRGAFGGLVSIYKSFGITKTLMESIGDVIGVEPFIISTFVNILLFIIVFTILLIIFNRSDSA